MAVEVKKKESPKGRKGKLVWGPPIKKGCEVRSRRNPGFEKRGEAFKRKKGYHL